MSPENLVIFTSIAFIATITPGPAIMLVSTNSLNYGVRKSILTILGNITGLFIMSLLSILGLSTFILYSAPVFFLVKIIGACYLIYLGIKLWMKGLNFNPEINRSNNQIDTGVSAYKLFLQGLFIALSNPKAIAFTTALFPQFIDTTLPLSYQFITLVSIFMLLSFSCLLAYAVMTSKVVHHSGGMKLQTLIAKSFGAIFIGFGLALAATTQK
ncbi:MAG: LysE family translocator [Gammaproteobacteria bacterium]|nr:LysE family translocator [Gammaproteobacteria bacterium]